MDPNRNRLKQLDLLSGLGAGFLGAGLALLFVRWLQPFAIPAVLIGILAHGWAMFARNSLEHQVNIERPKWAVAAEWVCWAMLVALAVLIFFALLK